MKTRVLASFVSVVATLTVAGTASAELVYGVTLDQTLISFDSAAPGTVLSGVAISGLQSNEVIRGIDLRPATGVVYGLGSFNRLYTINLTTGAATQVGSSFSPALNGSSFAFDFNPTVDRIRIVSDADQNFVLNPNTGAVQTTSPAPVYVAGDVNVGQNPNVVHAAYTNNVAGATSTTLFVIDSGRDSLARLNVATGALTTVGSLGLGNGVNDMGGFDISGQTGVAFAAVRNTLLSSTTFWSINLATGQGTQIGEVGGGAILTAITVVPAPSSMALLGLAGVIAGRRRR
ncbi:MAG: DUF4394 domain-containing protein [Phycisphaerales bacterium]|nr:DUF4394 domain-containing protein [Phycisphaerales bacterium]